MTELLDGRYRLVDEVGRGGSSTVWRGYDEKLSRLVAVKLLTDPHAHWVRDEARALALLAHPHIATVYDVGEHYLVTEFVDGRPLASAGLVSWPAAVTVGAQVGSALAAAHARGLVHRDVSPANIMLTPAGAKLIDFGIATFTGADEADPDGHVRGTPPYTAPERLTGNRAAPPADLYGLGAVLFLALTGRPFAPGARLDVDGLPPAVADVVTRCLAPDPADRPDASAVEAALRPHAALAPPGLSRALAPAGLSGALAPAGLSGALVAGGVAPAGGFVAGTAAVPELTRALPSLTAAQPPRTRTMPADPGYPRRRLRTGWFAAAAAALVLVLVAGVAIGLGLNRPAPAPAAASGPGCAVTYRLASDDGDTFVASILAANTGATLPAGWRLTVHLPSGTSGLRPDADWSVAGTDVSSPAQTPLAGGGSAQLSLSARHSRATVLPTAFGIGDRTCAAQVLGPDGATLAPGSTFTVQRGRDGRDGGDGGDNGNGHGGPGPG